MLRKQQSKFNGWHSSCCYSKSISVTLFHLIHCHKQFCQLIFRNFSIAGIGVGLATSAAFVALNHYFKEKRGQAVGLSMAGTALGMLILPQLVRILLEAYGFRGAVLLLAGLALHAVVGSTLLQPVKGHLIDAPIDVEQPPTTTEPAPSIKVDLISQVVREDDDDDLPEMKNLIFVNNKKLRKNFSEVAISSMGNGMAPKKHPTLVRIMSAASNTGMLSGGGTELSGSTSAVRKRRASVISHLSQLDFSGSSVQVHMNVSTLLLDDKV